MKIKFGGKNKMKKIGWILVSFLILFMSLPIRFIPIKAAEGLILTYSPSPLTAGCIPELVRGEEPFTITITNTNGEPVDLTLNGLVEDKVVWNSLFKDSYPKELPQFYWVRTDLHNDDGSLESNKSLFDFEPIKIDFSQANLGRYIFKGFCANDSGYFIVTAYTPDRRLAGSVKVEVEKPTVTYEIINTEDPDRNVFYVPGDPDFTMTAGDNRIYEITALAKNAQGYPIKGIDRDINICGGVKEFARFTPYTTKPSNFEYANKPTLVPGIYHLNNSNANFLANDGSRYYLHLGIDYNLNGKIDFTNKELSPMAGFIVKDKDANNTVVSTDYLTYYITSNVKWDDGTWENSPEFDFPPPYEGWGLGSIYNAPYNDGYLFADINEDGKLDYHDSLLFDVSGRCKFYIYAEDISKLGGLVACNYYGDKDVAGGPPLSKDDPAKITRRFNKDYAFFLDFDSFPSHEIGTGKPKIIGYDAKTGLELTRGLLNQRNYDLIYSTENHLEFRVIPTDLRDIPIEMDGIVSLEGNQGENTIYGRLRKEPDKVSWISATMFFTPTGLGQSVIWMDLYFENKNSPTPHSFKLEKVMYFDSVIGGGLEVSPSVLYSNEDNDVLISVSEIGTKKPIPGANIKLNGCGVSATGKTDLNGRLELKVKPLQTGEITVEASKENMLPGSTTIRVIQREAKLFLELDPLKSPTNQRNTKVLGKTLPLTDLVITQKNQEDVKLVSDEKGDFTFSVLLAEGLNQILVEAKNNRESVKKSIEITLDTTGPNLFINDVAKLIDQTETEISGRVEPGCKVFINSLPATVVNDIFKAIIPLKLQKNTVTVVAYDALDNSSTLTTEIYNYHQILIQLIIGKLEGKIDGKATILDAAPFIISGRTVVPVRFISEAFGAQIEWLNPTQTILIRLNDLTITMQIGNKTVFINGKASLLDAAPLIRNSRTFVPLRFLSEAFGCEIKWDSVTQEIILIKLI